jgi:hypothetical protein
MGQNLERAVQKSFSDAGLLGIESAEVTLDSGTRLFLSPNQQIFFRHKPKCRLWRAWNNRRGRCRPRYSHYSCDRLMLKILLQMLRQFVFSRARTE